MCDLTFWAFLFFSRSFASRNSILGKGHIADGGREGGKEGAGEAWRREGGRALLLSSNRSGVKDPIEIISSVADILIFVSVFAILFLI